MKVALGGVILVGVAAGLALPRGGAASSASAPASPVAAGEVPESTGPAHAAPSARPAPSWGGGETHLKKGASGHFFTTARVNGQPVEMVVDTGASIIALTEADARRIGVSYNPADFQVIGTGASGAVRGTEVTIDAVSVDGKEVRSLRAAVVEGLDVSLLGQSYLSRIGSVSMSGDEMVLR